VKIGWGEYRRRFLREMKSAGAVAALEKLRAMHTAGQAITLLCFCQDEHRCHRRLVKELLERR
jgi:uncharacterized protein YeaO (DUF488 family)